MKKHGWIIEMKHNHKLGWVGFYSADQNYYLTRFFDTAAVYRTRAEARYMLSTLGEVVRKVSLDKDGKAIEIIKGR